MRIAVLATAVGAFAAAACSSEGLLPPPLGLSHAAASRTCGPADGPAVAIYLSSSAITSLDPSQPYVRINVWTGADALVGTWSLSPPYADGSASRIEPETGDVDAAATGSVVVLSVGADTSVTGNVELTFPSGEHFRGGFTARWIPQSFLCG